MKKRSSLLLDTLFVVWFAAFMLCVYSAIIFVPIWGYFVLLTGQSNPLLWPQVEQVSAATIAIVLLYWMLKFFVRGVADEFRKIFKP